MPSPVLVNSRSPIPVQAQRMQQLEDRLDRLQTQISTQNRLTDPSDDPAGANRAMLLARQDARLQADQKAIDRANSRLSFAESAIVSGTEAVLRARDIALFASNAPMSDDDRLSMAREVAVLRTQLLESANARDESGRYLFAGSKSGSPAYVQDADGNALWQGMDSAAGAEAAGLANVTLPSGPALFGDDVGGTFAQLQALEQALLDPDPETRKAVLDTAIEGLRAGYNRLVDNRSTIGANMARLGTEENRIAQTRLTVAESLADVRGVDLTVAFAELNSLQLSLAAAQGSFARIYEGSLFDRLG